MQFTLVAQSLALFRHGGTPRALLLLALAAPPRAQADPPPLARAHSTVALMLPYIRECTNDVCSMGWKGGCMDLVLLRGGGG